MQKININHFHLIRGSKLLGILVALNFMGVLGLGVVDGSPAWARRHHVPLPQGHTINALLVLNGNEHERVLEGVHGQVSREAPLWRRRGTENFTIDKLTIRRSTTNKGKRSSDDGTDSEHASNESDNDLSPADFHQIKKTTKQNKDTDSEQASDESGNEQPNFDEPRVYLAKLSERKTEKFFKSFAENNSPEEQLNRMLRDKALCEGIGIAFLKCSAIEEAATVDALSKNFPVDIIEEEVNVPGKGNSIIHTVELPYWPFLENDWAVRYYVATLIKKNSEERKPRWFFLPRKSIYEMQKSSYGTTITDRDRKLWQELLASKNSPFYSLAGKERMVETSGVGGPSIFKVLGKNGRYKEKIGKNRGGLLALLNEAEIPEDGLDKFIKERYIEHQAVTYKDLRSFQVVAFKKARQERRARKVAVRMVLNKSYRRSSPREINLVREAYMAIANERNDLAKKLTSKPTNRREMSEMKDLKETLLKEYRKIKHSKKGKEKVDDEVKADEVMAKKGPRHRTDSQISTSREVVDYMYELTEEQDPQAIPDGEKDEEGSSTSLLLPHKDVASPYKG